MGMFSWVCKGCGEEIINGEEARFDGCKGIYDGYGQCGNFEHCSGEPVAWHHLCYKRATDKQKLDETPSQPAKNQGFGYPHLEFLPDYNPENKTRFFAEIVVSRGEGVSLGGEGAAENDYHFPEFLLTAKGFEDEKAWDKRAEAAREELSKAHEQVSDELWREYDDKWVANSPRQRQIALGSIDEAKALALKFIADKKFSEYTLSILGEQDGRNLRGVVYSLDIHQKRQYKEKGVVETGQYKTTEYVAGSGH